MALAAYSRGDLSISHLHGSNGVTEKIKKAMYESAKQFVYIGFLLKEVRDYKYYEEGGYENVYAYAEFELGFKKRSTKNFIAIAETFGIQKWEYQGIRKETQSMSLQPAYEEFNYSQLVELLAMSDAQRKQAKPDMTVKKLREIKRQPEKVVQVTIEELEEKATGQTSGHDYRWIKIREGEEPQKGNFVMKLVACRYWMDNKPKVGYRMGFYRYGKWIDERGITISEPLYYSELPPLPCKK